MLQRLIYPSLVLTVGRVEVIFDAVVGSSGQFFRNVCPLVAQSLVQIKYHSLLVFVNRIFLDVGVEVIMPSRNI
jgi:hypothetical protein